MKGCDESVINASTIAVVVKAVAKKTIAHAVLLVRTAVKAVAKGVVKALMIVRLRKRFLVHRMKKINQITVVSPVRALSTQSSCVVSGLKKLESTAKMHVRLCLQAVLTLLCAHGLQPALGQSRHMSRYRPLVIL